MEWPLGIIVLLSYMAGYTLSEKCLTPLGQTAKCLTIYDCPSFLNVVKKKQLSHYELRYLKKSKCGFQGTSKVCCGPIPDEQSGIKGVNGKDHSSEDSFPAPRDRCGVENLAHRIFSGEATEIDEFPWMALLGYRNNTKPHQIKYMCGGSLINHRYVLTAAHCLIGEYMDKYGPLSTVRLGEYDRSPESTVDCKYGICSDPPQEIPVLSAYPHPAYDIKSRTNDIAIVRLSSSATYTNFVQPICLTSGEKSLSNDAVLLLSGWGETLQGQMSTEKQKIKLTMFNKENCVAKYRSLQRPAFLIDSQLCVGGQFREGGCRGDSGGPLMRKTPEGVWEAVGIASFGRGCGLDGWPGVYTSVAHYLEWINSTLQESNK